MSISDKNFRVDILFPDEYEDFISEIYYCEIFVRLISQNNKELFVEFQDVMGSQKLIPLERASARSRLCKVEIDRAKRS